MVKGQMTPKSHPLISTETHSQLFALTSECTCINTHKHAHIQTCRKTCTHRKICTHRKTCRVIKIKKKEKSRTWNVEMLKWARSHQKLNTLTLLMNQVLFMQLRILCFKYLHRGCEKTGLSPVDHTRDEVISAWSMNLVYKLQQGHKADLHRRDRQSSRITTTRISQYECKPGSLTQASLMAFSGGWDGNAHTACQNKNK